MSLMTICAPSVLILYLHPTFSSTLLLNIINQIIIFIITAHVPAALTGRMSYVDIAWPWGLMAIGLLPVFSPPPEFTTRSFLVMTAFLVAGGRMALGRLNFL